MSNLILSNFTPAELQGMISSAVKDAIKELPVQPQAERETLLTRKEAANKLKISLVTLNDWTKRGMIPSYTIGGRVLYKDSELTESLHKTPATLKY